MAESPPRKLERIKFVNQDMNAVYTSITEAHFSFISDEGKQLLIVPFNAIPKKRKWGIRCI